MALTTQQRNNIVIWACLILMIMLTALERFTQNEKQYLPVFDTQYVLKEVKFVGYQWQMSERQWQCNVPDGACEESGLFWSELKAAPTEKPEHILGQSYAVKFYLQDVTDPLIFYWYPDQSLLQSQSKRWYTLPKFASYRLNKFIHP